MNEKKIRMVRGRTKALVLALTEADGSPYTMAEGEVLRFGVKIAAGNSECILRKELTAADAVEGGYYLTLKPEDTAGLPAGCYAYDVGLQSGADYFTVIEPSSFEVLSGVTAWEG